MSEPGLATTSVAAALPDPDEASNVAYNPSLERLREFSSDLETTTEHGAPAYVSDLRSRCADRTKNAVDDEFDDADHAHVETALEAARSEEMICLDRRVGRNPEHTYCCRYYVPRRYGRIALAVAKLFEPAAPDATPDFLTVQVPEWNDPETDVDTAIRVLPDEGLTAVLGSDYTGEAKKSFLRLYMYRVKQAGGLGLHAGSKRVTIRRADGDGDGNGDLEDVGQLFLGLSATGKSTLTAHGLWLDEPESAALLQDDVCALLPDGTVAGSEGNGMYVKTHELDGDEQPALYDAVTHESAVLENVAVDADGTVRFDSDEYTKNGRAVVSREHVASADADVDLEQVDQIFFITRNPAMPPVAKLSPDEAAAAFMLGESIQTSAGDPSSAGKSIRVVGTNPFIVGSEGAEGNRFRDLIDSLDVDCFVLNTGHLGPKSRDIGVEETVTILRELARGTVEWTDEATTGLTVPASVPGLDVERFRVADHVADHEETIRKLRSERREYLASFENLEEGIVDAVY